MEQPVEYNPLAYDALQDSMAREFMASPAIALHDITRFEGTGIYALFYSGTLDVYKPIIEWPDDWPLYVGKAAPTTRKGNLTTESGLGTYGNTFLYDRLHDHMRSIEMARNLSTQDFTVRLLVLSYIWVPLAETAMIARYQPIWNSVVDGFGNHDPGGGRANGVRSRWDTMHPGRPWASKYPARKETPEDIAQEVAEALRISMW